MTIPIPPDPIGRRAENRSLRSCQFDHHQDNQELLKLQAEGLQVELSNLDFHTKNLDFCGEKVSNPEIFGGLDIKSTQKGCHRFLKGTTKYLTILGVTAILGGDYLC